MLAAATHEDVWRLSAEEANRLTRAMENVGRHYDIRTNQKAVDWAALTMAVGSVYGTRLYAVSLKRQAARAERQTSANGHVAPIWNETDPFVPMQ